MKYIVVKDQGFECVRVFDELQEHRTVADNREVVSAGFCSFGYVDDRFNVSCWGESVSLNIKIQFQSLFNQFSIGGSALY
jgi:hypothetical protein